ncbi:MAG TPA: hypothetical protein VFX96_17635 [Pyrinomonadaceae bacterium]|nr:hypothetical protein [Pyrinomonadaceae bacterium]
MSEEDELEKWRKERGIPKEEIQRLLSPELRMLQVIEKLTDRVVTNEKEAGERNERIERNIDFIIQQQAQFSADLQQLRETQARAEQSWEERHARADEKWSRTENGIHALLAAAEIQAGEINALKEAQERTDRQMAETDERLNALINFVERQADEGRNGGQSS